MEYDALDSDVVARPRVRSIDRESEPGESVAYDSDHVDVGPAIAAPAAAMHPASLIGLQRTAGNAAVTALLQRKMADMEAEEDEGTSPVLDVVGKGGGEPLTTELRDEMEARLGDDFSDVRVHTNTDAADSAAAVSARAYTVGNEIVFGADAPDLDSADGKHTLAHELTHVVQQRSGPVAGTPTGDGISISDPTDEFELAAEGNATQVMSDLNTDAHTPAAAAGPAAMQRALTDEDEDAESEMGEPDLLEPELVEPDLVDEEIEEEEEEEAPVQGLWVQRAPEDTYTLGDEETDEEEAEEEEQDRDTEELTDEVEAEEDVAGGEEQDEEGEMEMEQEEAEAEADNEAAESEEESE